MAVHMNQGEASLVPFSKSNLIKYRRHVRYVSLHIRSYKYILKNSLKQCDGINYIPFQGVLIHRKQHTFSNRPVVYISKSKY